MERVTTLRRLAGHQPGRHHRNVTGRSFDNNPVPSNVTVETDSALVTRMSNGDESALAALYDRHGRLAWSLAYAVLGDAADAEEAVADAFLQAWTSAASFDAARSSVAGWITMMTRSRALDRVRARGRRSALIERVTTVAGVDATTPSNPPDPSAHAERREAGEQIASALAQLPHPQRRVIELAFFGGLSHSEIAEELGEPLGTVKTRLRAAMEKLRAALAVQAPA
jgi:RNA polymerase sigma-70 factor (ECF subfamily)